MKAQTQATGGNLSALTRALAAIAILLLGWGQGWIMPATAQDAPPPLAMIAADMRALQLQVKPQPVSKLAPELVALAQTYTEQGQFGLQRIAAEQRIVTNAERVLVVIEGDTTRLPALVTQLGAQVDSVAADRFSALVTVTMLKEIAALPGVAYVRLPLPMFEAAALQTGSVTSEGVAVLQANEWHTSGYTGQGVVAGIVDLGFYDWQALRTAGDLPTNTVCVDYATGTGCANGNAQRTHGSATAEILYDMAPGIHTLYIYTLDDDADMSVIVDHMIANHVKVASLSLGWLNGEPYDGSGPISTQINRARAHDIFFAVAAGNYQQQHYEATFNQGNCSWGHDFDSSGSCANLNGLGYYAQNAQICLYMAWNAWPVTNQDYDLFVYRYRNGSPALVRTFNTFQNGTPPVEGGCFNATNADYYFFLVHKYSASTNHHFEIFSTTGPIGVPVAQSSIAEPATANGAVTTAVFAYNTPDELRDYSSQGPRNPTGGGPYNLGVCGSAPTTPCKPDFAAPDGVSTVSYGTTNAYGSSFAAPHVAGAAALVRSAYPLYTVEQTYNFIKTWSVKPATMLLSTDQDYAWGWGRIGFRDAPRPTAVTLTDFTALALDDTILITWETASELDNLGFNLYRSTSAAGPWVRLNTALIPPQYPGQVFGGEYEYLDTTAQSGITYYYRLEDIDTYGVRTIHGPVWAVMGSPHWQVYLPLVQHTMP